MAANGFNSSENCFPTVYAEAHRSLPDCLSLKFMPVVLFSFETTGKRILIYDKCRGEGGARGV